MNVPHVYLRVFRRVATVVCAIAIGNGAAAQKFPTNVVRIITGGTGWAYAAGDQHGSHPELLATAVKTEITVFGKLIRDAGGRAD